MTALPLLPRAMLTAALILTSGFCLRRCLPRTAASTPIGRLNDATHVLMGVEMIAMAWSLSVPDPLGVQVVAFAGAAGWFLVQATGVPITRAALRPAMAGGPRSQASPSTVCTSRSSHGSPSRPQCLHHAALMVTMIWMLGAGRVPARHASMAGMVMPSVGGVSFAGVAPVAGAYCLVVAGVWAAVAIWRRRRQSGTAVVRYLATDPLMTAAMGLMLITMA